MRELFPFWKGKSVDEYCEDQYREAGVWGVIRRVLRIRLLLPCIKRRRRLQPGYDVILMKKGMLDIQNEAREHLTKLHYENPDDIEKIYFYKSIIENN